MSGHFHNFAALILLALILSSCGIQKEIRIKGTDLYTYEKNGRTQIEMESVFSIGQLKLPDGSLPLAQGATPPLGEVNFQNLEDGTSRVAISLDLEQVLALKSNLETTLPNGRKIPLSLPNHTVIKEIPFLGRSRIYLIRHEDGALNFGMAINIPAFDTILSSSGQKLNLFKSDQLSKEVSVISGIYSSQQNGLNGLAFFSNRTPISSIFNRSPAAARFAAESDDENSMSLLTALRLNLLFQKNSILRIK